jgi:DNA-binding IclR family transcriptional regulator
MATIAERILAHLDRTPRTTHEVAKALGISPGQAGNTLRTLSLRGDVTETMAEAQQGARLIAGWMIAKPREVVVVERGEYKGERLPLRYRQRDEAGITLGRIGID